MKGWFLQRKGKKVGRSVGATHKAYSQLELSTAFELLIEICPANVSGNDFLQLLQKVRAVTPLPGHNLF